MIASPRSQNGIRWIGFVLGPCLAIVFLAFLPHRYLSHQGEAIAFSLAGRTTLALGAWMAVWWLSDTIHISATALLPLALFPVLGVADMKTAAAPYAHPFIFLFMGGFLMALSMQRWRLDRRIALLTLRLVGTRPRNMVAGFMLATAVLSAFVSNTATTAMMLPIALSIVELIRRNDAHDEQRTWTDRFSTCLMLGVAYAASMGGLATIIGTPPNAFLAGYLRDTIDEAYRLDISFAKWLQIGLPAALVMLPATWLMLCYLLFPIGGAQIKGGAELIESELRALGKPSRGEWITFIVFSVTATLWITRPLITKLQLADGSYPLAGLSDAGLAMLAAITLFITPVDLASRQFTLDWETARRLPWGILVLFGGGLSLAAAVQNNGVGEFLGSCATSLRGVPPLLVVLCVTAGMIFLTELTSNAATTATLVPVLSAMAPGFDVHPYLLIFPATLAASCKFMLPVATPPNAIAYGSGYVELRHMIRAGFWLNLIGIVVLSLLSTLLIPRLMINA